jgi:hypothetical protein
MSIPVISLLPLYFYFFHLHFALAIPTSVHVSSSPFYPFFLFFFLFLFFKVLISFIPLFIEPAWLVALWFQPWQQMETISDQTVFLVDLLSLIALFLSQP